MTTLAADTQRNYEQGVEPIFNDLPMIASDILYRGAAVGESSSDGTMRPLVAADTFWGFAEAKADNSAGAASAIDVQVRQQGIITIPVTGAASAANNGAAVYADDDNSFTLTSSSNTAIGKVVRWVTSTTCQVFFQGTAVQSV